MAFPFVATAEVLNKLVLNKSWKEVKELQVFSYFPFAMQSSLLLCQVCFQFCLVQIGAQ